MRRHSSFFPLSNCIIPLLRNSNTAILKHSHGANLNNDSTTATISVNPLQFTVYVLDPVICIHI